MHGRSADDHVVGEDDRERLVADEVLRHQHRMAEAELLLLADVGDLGEVGDRPDLAQHLDVALLLEQVLELEGEVEMVLDRPLLARGDDDDLLDPGSHGLLDRVLDDRLVDQRQHLLRLRLRGGKEAGPPACRGEDGLSNAHRTSGTRGVGGRASIAGVSGVAGRSGPAGHGRCPPRAVCSSPIRSGLRERGRPRILSDRAPGQRDDATSDVQDAYGRRLERRGPGAQAGSDSANRRTARLNAAGRSRFARCVAPASRTRRTSCATAANEGANSRNGRSYSPLRISDGPG